MIKKWKRVIVFAVIAVVVLAAVIYGIAIGFPKQENKNSAWEPINLTEENLPQHLSRYTIVYDLPEEGIIALKIGERGYTIKKGQASHGLPSEPDVTLSIPKKYLEVFGQYGWCAGLATAWNNGDVAVEMQESQAALAWKYKSMFKYKNCLG